MADGGLTTTIGEDAGIDQGDGLKDTCSLEAGDSMRASLETVGLEAADDAFETGVLVERCLDGFMAPFVKEGDKDAWRGSGLIAGCGYCDIRVSCSNTMIDVSIGSGVRVPTDRRVEVNKYLMLSNSDFRQCGFKMLRKDDDEVVFAFDAGTGSLESASDRRMTDGALIDGSADDPEDDVSEAIDRMMRSVAGNEEEESALSLGINLGISSIKKSLPALDAIVFLGRRALDVYDG